MTGPPAAGEMARRLTLAALAATAATAATALLLLAPAPAGAHAYLIRTSPLASGVLDAPPNAVDLTFDEAVEPRFAIVSVTDVSGRPQTAGAVDRSPASPDTLVVALGPRLAEGWYLVYWRAISVDGHPVQGAFTFAVGPNPGPAPQFPVPKVSATAITTPLLIARWTMFITVMSAIGLFALRLAVARAAVRRLPEVSLRAVSTAFIVASVLGLIAIPVYLDVAVANDSLRSVFDLGALAPLYRVTTFGRGYLDLELCFGLFCLAAWITLWLDRPERDRRSVAELIASTGAALAAAAVLIIPGAVGHAGQTSPRGLSLLLDFVHLLAGSVWLGGLLGLLVLWRSLGSVAGPGAASRLDVLAVVVPRFSALALASVLTLLASGAGATLVHMPTLSALWETGYGVAILVKLALLGAAMALGAVNLLRTKPALLAAGRRPASASALLRRLVSGEAVLVAGAVFTASVLSSLAPPPPAFALQSSALAQVGPGRVAARVERAGYRLEVLVSPNLAAAPDTFALRITRSGRPVTGASVTLTFNHTEMQMPQQEYRLAETQPGVYSRAAPALVMVGRWALSFQIAPNGQPPFTALILDQASG